MTGLFSTSSVPKTLVPFLRKVVLHARTCVFLPLFLSRRVKLAFAESEVVVLLSMGGQRGSPILARELRVRGYEVILVSKDAPSYEAKYISSWIRADATDRSSLEARLGDIKEISPVLVVSEMKNVLLPGVSYLTNELGLVGVSQKGAENSNSKVMFRDALESAGVGNCRWGVVEEGNGLDIPYPVVVKPDRGTGSRGVILVEGSAGLREATSMLSNDPLVGGSFMYEQVMEGDQYDIEGVTANGEHTVVIRVFEKYERVSGKFPTGWYLLNCPLSEEKQAALDAYVKSCLDALGVVEGAWHIEVKEISDNVFSAIDFSNRMGYPNLVSAAIDRSFPGLYIDALRRDMNYDKERSFGSEYMVFQKYIYTREEAALFRALAASERLEVVEFKDTRNAVGGVDLFGRIAFRFKCVRELSRALSHYGLNPVGFDSQDFGG